MCVCLITRYLAFLTRRNWDAWKGTLIVSFKEGWEKEGLETFHMIHPVMRNIHKYCTHTVLYNFKPSYMPMFHRFGF